MNIFVLHEDPVIAASYHCDQHLHKMILESAQMLSTAARSRKFTEIDSWLYKSAYQNHPCTIWTSESNHNMLWLCELASELDSLRDSATHASMEIVKYVQSYIVDLFPYAVSKAHDPFIFCGPAILRIRRDLTIPQKYQSYYLQKHAAWLDSRSPMSYKGRPLPPFLSHLSSRIPHG